MNTTSPNRAFTLIELLIVIAAMAMLMGMMSSLVGIAQRQVKLSQTRATMMKVDQAVRLFRSDMKVYPWQTDLSQAETDPTQWTNNLAWRLAWKPTASERADYLAKCQADLDLINARFLYRTGDKVDKPNGDGSHAFRTEDTGNLATINTYVTNMMLSSGSTIQADDYFTKLVGGSSDSLAYNGYVGRLQPEHQPMGQVLSRMASEVTVLKYLAGQSPVEAPSGIDPADPAVRAMYPNEDARYTQVAYTPGGGTGVVATGYRYIPYNGKGFFGDDRRGPALKASEAQASGWRSDYLGDALRRQTSPNSRGEIDPTGTSVVDAWGRPLVYVCKLTCGARGYKHSLQNNGSSIDEVRYGMGPTGRTVTTLLASDIRTTAAKAFAFEFELWSAGPDGRFAALRDDTANRDNLPMLGYNRDLK